MSNDCRDGDRPGPASTRTVDLESTVSLVQRARAGDEEAVDRLLARHVTPLRRWARGKLPAWARDAADTDDLVQDTANGHLHAMGLVAGRHAARVQWRRVRLEPVFTIRPDGTDMQAVNVDGADPAWSPDGRTLAFVSDPDPSYCDYWPAWVRRP